ncbi:natriuretic peptides B [Synchiropus splendidus]|uniref:natriuretic peptides B n=1 Tax=Synchiropus splendidus TaxID=270530 RepID=UPI00237DB939|nr:natriuretic peptides B [Synchiropus splendidus]
MGSPAIIACSLLLIFNLQLITSHPIGLTSNDVDVLKDLLRRLEVLPEQADVDNSLAGEHLDTMSSERAEEQSRSDLDEDTIREFLSLKNLKSFSSDSSRRSSNCFGGKIDRIGTMSSLGCNTAGKYNPKRQ